MSNKQKLLMILDQLERKLGKMTDKELDAAIELIKSIKRQLGK